MLNQIISFALRNRLIVIVSALLISCYGAFLALRMPVDVLPDVNRPTITIMTEAKTGTPVKDASASGATRMAFAETSRRNAEVIRAMGMGPAAENYHQRQD